MDPSQPASYFSSSAWQDAKDDDRAVAVVWMTPSEFLALALPGNDEDKARKVNQVLVNGTPFSSIPYLNVDFVPGGARVVGHEGRHRTMALRFLGVPYVPVRLRALNRGSSQTLTPEVGGAPLPWPKTPALSNPAGESRWEGKPWNRISTPEDELASQIADTDPGIVAAYEEELRRRGTPSLRGGGDEVRWAMEAAYERGDLDAAGVAMLAADSDYWTFRGESDDPAESRVRRLQQELAARSARRLPPTTERMATTEDGGATPQLLRFQKWERPGDNVLNPRPGGFTRAAVLTWLKNNRFSPIRVEEEGRYWVALLTEERFKVFRTKDLRPGVQMVLGMNVTPEEARLQRDVAAWEAQQGARASWEHTRAEEVERCPCSANQDASLWLKTDHAEIHDLLADIGNLMAGRRRAGSGAERQQGLDRARVQFDLLVIELEVHFKTEEASVFDRLANERGLSPKDRRTLAKIRAEHAPLLEEAARVGSNGLLTGFPAFRARLLDHAKREDALLLP